MPRKRIVKIIILSVFTIALITVGYIMFQRLDYNQEVFDADINTYVPKQASEVILVNRKTKDMFLISNLMPKFAKELSAEFTYPYYLVQVGDNDILLFKANKEKEKNIRLLLEKKGGISFATKRLKYKDVTIYSYPSDGNTFLSCIFHNGVFACSSNYKMLEYVIDAIDTSSFFSNSAILRLRAKVSETYSANIFIKKEEFAASYNLTKSGDDYLLDGYALPASYIEQDSCHLQSGGWTTDYAIIPDSANSFEIQQNKVNVADTVHFEFQCPSYKIFLSGDSSGYGLYAIKFSQSRFRVFDMMDAIESRISGKSLVLHGSIAKTKYNLYTGSREFCKYFFKKDNDIYFSFYNSYLVYSENRGVLESYILSAKRGYIQKEIADLSPSDNDVSLFYYGLGYPRSETVKLFPLHKYLAVNSQNISLIRSNIVTYTDGDYLKINLLINNYK